MMEVICSGIGGQGVLVAGMILADIAMEEGQPTHDASYGKGCQDAIAKCSIGTVHFAGTVVLGNEGSHGLTECGWYEHDECTYFFCYADTGTGFKAQ